MTIRDSVTTLPVLVIIVLPNYSTQASASSAVRDECLCLKSRPVLKSSARFSHDIARPNSTTANCPALRRFARMLRSPSRSRQRFARPFRFRLRSPGGRLDPGNSDKLLHPGKGLWLASPPRTQRVVTSSSCKAALAARDARSALLVSSLYMIVIDTFLILLKLS
jgi:hypothetical protein